MTETVLEVREVRLTAKHVIHLSQITRYHLITAINSAVSSARFDELKPKEVEGYSHETALEFVTTYKEQWQRYEAEVNKAQVYTWIGIAWQVASLDMTAIETEVERAALDDMGAKMKLPHSPAKDVVDTGALIYSLVELLKGPEVVGELVTWLRKGAGLLDASLVEEERKSPQSDGEQPPPAGSVKRDEGKAKGRR